MYPLGEELWREVLNTYRENTRNLPPIKQVATGYTKRDSCNRCAKYYDELSPTCANYKIHEDATAEREAKQT